MSNNQLSFYFNESHLYENFQGFAAYGNVYRASYCRNNENHQEGTYVIRNEGLRPLEYLKPFVNESVLKNAHKDFVENFVNLFSEVFKKSQVVIEMEYINQQLADAEKLMRHKNVISLDTYFKGTYNLEVSRLFDVSCIQLNYSQLIGRVGKESLKDQVKQIKKGNYILVDDDSVSGKTLRSVEEALPEDVNISDTYFLANSNKQKIFDVVDLRDFIVGAENGGLACCLPNNNITRVPYIQPYVSLTKYHMNSPTSISGEMIIYKLFPKEIEM